MSRTAPASPTSNERSERAIGRLLIAMTYVAVAVLIVGVALMAAAGITPLTGAPAFDAAALPAQLAAAAPAGILYVGIIAVIATPIARVIGAALSYGSAGDWRMVGISLAILAVIALAVVIAVAGTV